MSKKQSRTEIYTLSWCPYCKKTKAFFRSKGISYKEYQIDDNESKKAEMQERSGGKKRVPMIFIDNKYIGGYDELIKAKETGELTDLLGLSKPEDFDQIWDVVIIGAGPAGLSAAIYSARKGLDVLVLSLALGEQVIETDIIKNYIGISSIDGPELMDSFWNHSQEYDIKNDLGVKVNNISLADDLKVIETKNYNVKTRTVIVASGTHKRELGVSREKQLKGKGVHYCAICDGFLYAGKEVAVVGGGNSGLEASLDMARLNSKVNLIEVADHLMGDQILKKKVFAEDLINVYTCNNVEAIKGKDTVRSIVIRDNNTGKVREFDVNAVFVEIGLIPNSGFVSDLVQTNNRNEIVINNDNETSVEGIWAAGDVTDIKDKQIIVATAEGAKAALRVNEYLNK
ncbi:MAG TPA: FAD-dependent oxidoreductase [Halanaerobiales bacterium]|nr:FAD-dependent oxidoreductase [Halanaerobiales bacterium]